MDLETDREFFWIAEQGLREPVPEGWKGCMTDDGDLYYFNFETGDSQWNHPNDDKYKDLFQREKEKSQKRRAQGPSSLPPVVSGGRRPSMTTTTTTTTTTAPRREALAPLKTAQPLGAIGSGVAAPVVPVPEVDEDLTFTLSEDDGESSDVDAPLEDVPPRPSAPTPPMHEDTEEQTAAQRESALQAILAQAEEEASTASEADAGWRETEERAARDAYLGDLDDRLAEWKADEERRQREGIEAVLARRIEDLKARHEREAEAITGEHNARVERCRRENELELSSERQSQERRLADMHAAWDAEVQSARLAAERRLREVTESAGEGRLAEEVARLQRAHSERVQEESGRLRSAAEVEHRQVAEEFEKAKRAQRERLNAELAATREANDAEVASLEAHLAAERSALAERRHAEMALGVDRECEAECEALRRREEEALARLRECAEGAERRAEEAEAEEKRAKRVQEERTPIPRAAAPSKAPQLLHIPPREDAPEPERRVPRPPAPTENAGPLQSSLRGESLRIAEQEAALRERREELKRHKHEIEAARDSVRRDLAALQADHGAPDAQSRREAIGDVRDALELEAAMHNHEISQIKATRRYLELRRRRVELMQSGVVETASVSSSGTLSPVPLSAAQRQLEDDVANVETELAGVLEVMRREGGVEEPHQARRYTGAAAALRTKYEVMYPDLARRLGRPPPARAPAASVPDTQFALRMRSFRQQLMAWEGERETAEKQLQRHRQWLRRFRRDVQWRGRDGAENQPVQPAIGAAGGTITINLNVR